MNLDLKSGDGLAAARALVEGADALIEGFRPGVMERLGLGPQPLLEANPSLVYARMTGWGQQGPLAHTAGHDINYIALTGALHAFGRANEKPTPPINMVGDFGGGGMLLAFGVLAGILHVRSGGAGQVVDCAMIDGASLLMSMIWGFRAKGVWRDERGANYLDTGAFYYDTYETKDGKYVAIGAIEPQFYALLLDRLGLSDDPLFKDQNRLDLNEARKQRLTALFATRTREAWRERLEGCDACFAPVLDFADAPLHPHNRDRGAFLSTEGVTQPRAAPRFSTVGPERQPGPSGGLR